MADTHTAEVAASIQTFWSTLFMDKLRQTNLMFNQVNRDYTGEIRQLGDTVKVMAVNDAAGQTLTKDGSGGEATFTPEAVGMTSVNIVANKRFVASYAIDDTIDFQSLLSPTSTNSVKLRNALMEGVSKQINTFIYGLITGGTVTASTAAMTAVVMAGAREVAGKKKWKRDSPWYGNLSPEYWADCLVDQTLASSDFADGQILVGGMAGGVKRLGFNLFEDTSLTNKAVFFHPDVVYFVTQYEPRFKISDSHVNNKFGHVLSVDIFGGGVLGIEGADKYNEIKVAS